MILDEADEFIFDSANAITAPNIVGLTATALEDLEDNSMADLLLQPKYMGFRLINSHIDSQILSSSYEEATFTEFLKASRGMAKLIYTNEESYATVKADLGEENVKEDITDPTSLKSMKAGDAFITSKEGNMRAHDYRALDCNSGIALFIEKPLSCRRILVQAFGRVGRYGQPCRRFVKKGLEILDN